MKPVCNQDVWWVFFFFWWTKQIYRCMMMMMNPTKFLFFFFYSFGYIGYLRLSYKFYFIFSFSVTHNPSNTVTHYPAEQKTKTEIIINTTPLLSDPFTLLLSDKAPGTCVRILLVGTCKRRQGQWLSIQWWQRFLQPASAPSFNAHTITTTLPFTHLTRSRRCSHSSQEL